ncbi:MAG: AAA family ATPase [Archangium sp.]|nr:AAA family ATPase [Archangium sp.]MDP3152454.1 AAA family ATPase [Archangium sp.]MDP3572376.1 AAA family ATPase [Archangium sp.]
MNAPSHWSDEVRFTESSTAFRGFFTELREAFVERESLFTQLELALLCKEHVLIIGPPGTAKSAIAGAVLGRIVDEKSGRPSLFSKQLAENTVQTDLIGPVDFKVLTETGRTEHLTEEGMLGAVHAFLDEVFDGRDMLLRSILNVLHERELKHGRKVTPGRCECAVMTSNRYLSEVLQRSPETLQAFADRISFICFAPKSFSRRSSRGQMLHRAQTGQRPALHARMTLQQLDVLQEAVEAVEVPPLVAEGMEELADTLERDLLSQVAKLTDYVPTKYFSQRSMVKALWVLKAIVVRDRMYRRPERRLVAEPADLEMLRHFFILGGPVEAELDALLKISSDPRERAQLEIIRVEHKTFATAYAKLQPSLQQSLEREAADLKAQEDVEAAEGQGRGWTASVASTTAIALRTKLVPGPRHPDNRKPLLRAAELLLHAMDQRCARGMAGQGEGRGGVALLGSFGDVLELAHRVPELQSRLPNIARSVADFSKQAAEMIALAAEGTEFDDAVRLDGVSGIASNLAEELERIGELVQVAGSIVPEVVEPVRAHLTTMRERTSIALRRRATRTFAQSQSGRKGEPLELLIGDSRRLRELERCLVELSPSHAGLRVELLAPLAEQYARDVLTVQPFGKLEQLLRMMQGVVDNLAREGASPNAALRVARDEVERRVTSYAEGLTAPKGVAPDAAKILSGEPYTFYRQQLSAHAIEGDLNALKSIDDLLRSVGAVPLAPEARELVANAEVQSLGVRVRYLSTWWGLVEAALPLDKLRSPADADKAFDGLVKSRFPLLVTREGEFVRLGSAIARLSHESGQRAEVIRALLDESRKCEEAFSRFSRRLIDSRTPRR